MIKIGGTEEEGERIECHEDSRPDRDSPVELRLDQRPEKDHGDQERQVGDRKSGEKRAPRYRGEGSHQQGIERKEGGVAHLSRPDVLGLDVAVLGDRSVPARIPPNPTVDPEVVGKFLPGTVW